MNPKAAGTFIRNRSTRQPFNTAASQPSRSDQIRNIFAVHSDLMRSTNDAKTIAAQRETLVAAYNVVAA